MEKYHSSTSLVIYLTISSIILIARNPACLYATEPDTSFYNLFEQALQKYHQEDYEGAIQLALQIRKSYPEEPAGVFALLTTYQTMMRNYRVRYYESQYDSLLDLVVKLSKKAIKRDKKNGVNYFYLGCAYGSRSIYYARRRQWMKAFRDGSQVLNNFKKAVSYSPEFYDAYYGLGLYKYWLSAKAKFLLFLPFVKDQRREGIEQIKLAAEKGRFLKIDSMYGLVSVYYNEGMYEEALKVNDQLYERYPNNPSLLYRRGRILQALGRWQEAMDIFSRLHEILSHTRLQSISFMIDCLFQMAKCHYTLGNYLETQRLCNLAMELEKSCDFSKELDGPIEKYEDIKKQLHELTKKVKKILVANITQHKK